jgi:hypothetical protein
MGRFATEFAYTTLDRELQFGVGMVLFCVFMLLVIRHLAKKTKLNKRQKDYALVAIYMSLNAGFVGVIVLLHYIFSTIFS